jgi:hypothetical protein
MSCNVSIDDNLNHIDNLGFVSTLEVKDAQMSFDDLFEILELKVIPDHVDYFIADVNKADIFDNKIFMLDVEYRNGLYCYDILTNSIFQVGKKGDGPGEYQDLQDFFIDKDSGELWLLNNKGGVIETIRFSLNGQYIDSRVYTDHMALGFEKLNDGYLILSTQGWNNIPPNRFYDFQIIDSKGKLFKNYLSTPKVLVEYSTPQSLPLSKSANGSIIGTSKSMPYIFEFFNKDSLRIFDLNFSKPFIDKNQYDKISSEEYDFWYNYSEPLYHTIDRAFLIENFLFYVVMFGSQFHYGFFDLEIQKNTVISNFKNGIFNLPMIPGAVAQVDDMLVFYLNSETIQQLRLDAVNQKLSNSIPSEIFDGENPVLAFARINFHKLRD